MVTYQAITENAAVKQYILHADHMLKSIGYTEHSFAHVTRTAHISAQILTELGYPPRTIELAKIASHLHDIGNLVNRVDHAQSGAVMAFRILDNLGMAPEEIAMVVSAIGNHDEHTAAAVTPIAAALILADKSDVRRSRVRNQNMAQFDIHDRVNYAVEQASVSLNHEKKQVVLALTIDTDISPVLDYFEIFMARMILCKHAAQFLQLKFVLMINGQKLS